MKPFQPVLIFNGLVAAFQFKGKLSYNYFENSPDIYNLFDINYAVNILNFR